ncbi:MAG: hypothetical protein KBA18_10200, partial [Kiritimatiellae bacterium]|nr:hypothetical protein [Kiritimatiellia bacterium]
TPAARQSATARDASAAGWSAAADKPADTPRKTMSLEARKKILSPFSIGSVLSIRQLLTLYTRSAVL